MRRFPLWLTPLPLVIGLAAYWHFWSDYRDTLRADIARVVPGAAVTVGGFPYRMEARAAAPAVAHPGPMALSLRATSALVNRGPWQRDLTVVRTANPEIAVAVPLRGVSARLTAAVGESSLHLVDGRIVRQSNVLTDVRATLGAIAVPISAAKFEFHLRELVARSNEAWSPTPPPQAQVVLAGTGVRIGNGAPLTLAADIAVTATSRLRDFAGWADGGTVEVHALTLADASGEVARLTATAVPAGGTVRLGGTIETVCPATVAAAFAGTKPPAEWRSRLPFKLAFGGTPGAFTLAPAPVPAPHAVRAQLPPCPALR